MCLLLRIKVHKRPIMHQKNFFVILNRLNMTLNKTANIQKASNICTYFCTVIRVLTIFNKKPIQQTETK